jgi:hypothetical protein
VAGEVALYAAADFPVGLSFGAAALDVGLGFRMAAHAADGDGVQGAVELAVSEAVDAVPVGAAGPVLAAPGACPPRRAGSAPQGRSPARLRLARRREAPTP